MLVTDALALKNMNKSNAKLVETNENFKKDKDDVFIVLIEALDIDAFSDSNNDKNYDANE